MSATAAPDPAAVEQELTRLAELRPLFLQMQELARRTSTCSVPALQRDSELILATIEQALELLELGEDERP